MKIFILSMDDPLYTIPFLKTVIDARAADICGVALVTKGDRLTVRRNQSKLAYLVALLVILGPIEYGRNVAKSLAHWVRGKLAARFPRVRPSSLLDYAEVLSIRTFEVTNPNREDFLASLRELQPDVIINQSQSILKSELLSIPRLGTVNRHNALLPKNRGRLTPFWVKYKREPRTGVSIHFVDEKIDAGAIVVQKSFPVLKSDSISDIVRKNYEIAPDTMLEALDKLEKGDDNFLPNDDADATYNSIPTLRDAFRFRFGLSWDGNAQASAP